MSLAYRRAEERDLALVIDSWLESYRFAHAAGLIALDDWRDVMVPQVKRVLARPGVAVHVAYHPGETDQRADLYGWIAVERDYVVPVRGRERIDGTKPMWIEKLVASDCPLVHFVYVKEAYRRMGIARGLFKAARVDPTLRFLHTCKTAVVTELKRAIPRAVWSPLIARQPLKEISNATEQDRADSGAFGGVQRAAAGSASGRGF